MIEFPPEIWHMIKRFRSNIVREIACRRKQELHQQLYEFHQRLKSIKLLNTAILLDVMRINKGMEGLRYSS